MLYEERREAMRRAPDEMEKEFADVPTEKLKAILIAAQMETDKRLDAERSKVDVTVWLNLHPEYINSDRNRALMRHELGGAINPTVAELEEAYQALRGSNVLELNKAELAKQEKQATKDRSTQIKEDGGPLASPYSEDDLYSMPMETLPVLGNGGFIR